MGAYLRGGRALAGGGRGAATTGDRAMEDDVATGSLALVAGGGARLTELRDATDAGGAA